jgi:ABC-type proline/glycine betaine transport system substrate-binding protein
MSVTEEQVNELGSRINVTRCSIEGASDWLEDNWEVVESWIQASEKIENT